MKFKVGDKVRVNAGYSFDGEVCTITLVHESGLYDFVKASSFDKYIVYTAWEEQLELVKEEEKTMDMVKVKRTKKGNIQLTMSEDVAFVLRVVVGKIMGPVAGPRGKTSLIYDEMNKIFPFEEVIESDVSKKVIQNLKFKEY